MQEEYCTLDPISRKLTLTEPQRIAGVESDENAKGLKFKFPKTVDDIDLTQMQLRINFMNSRQEKGQHIVTDMKPMEGEEGYITFTWPFSRLVTHYRGLTKFVICAVKTDENGTITAEWNTALAQMRVLEGLEVDEPEISPEEKDVISQLISICQNSADKSAQSAQQAQEEAKKVLTYGPEIGENGNWFVGGKDTGKPSRGEPGPKGEPGDAGEKGDPGKPGANGETPVIGDNSNWFIGGVDTGKPSRGEKGDKGDEGDPGKPGATPEIGDNGNWYVNEVDTGKPSKGPSGELLLAEYIHQGNQEIYFSSFDWATGIGECTEPHGLTKTTRIMIVPNDWWTGAVSSNGLSIPIEFIFCQSSYLYVSIVDDTHLKIVGGTSDTSAFDEITVDTEDPQNKNIDCTRFHFEIGRGFEIKNFPVEPTSLRVTISGFVTGGKSYRYLFTDVKTHDGTIIGLIYGQSLAIPKIGTTDPRFAIYQSYDMVVDYLGTPYIPFHINAFFWGRRKTVSTSFFADFSEQDETKVNVTGLNSFEQHGGFRCFYNLRCSDWPVYSNHSVVKVYAKAVIE